MEKLTRPLYLLADSQLFFLKDESGRYYLDSIRTYLGSAAPQASYVGASNGDLEEFYDIFLEGMRNLGVTNCRMIKSSFDASDKTFLKESNIIVLAGGDTDKGMEIFSRTGMKEILTHQAHQGSIIIGVSAGAIQLGWERLTDHGAKIDDCLRIVPFQVSAHSEDNDWRELKRIITASSSMNRGFGIPYGGGLVYHPDNTVEALRKPLSEFVYRNNELQHALLLSEHQRQSV